MSEKRVVKKYTRASIALANLPKHGSIGDGKPYHVSSAIAKRIESLYENADAKKPRLMRGDEKRRTKSSTFDLYQSVPQTEYDDDQVILMSAREAMVYDPKINGYKRMKAEDEAFEEYGASQSTIQLQNGEEDVRRSRPTYKHPAKQAIGPSSRKIVRYRDSQMKRQMNNRSTSDPKTESAELEIPTPSKPGLKTGIELESKQLPPTSSTRTQPAEVTELFNFYPLSRSKSLTTLKHCSSIEDIPKGIAKSKIKELQEKIETAEVAKVVAYSPNSGHLRAFSPPFTEDSKMQQEKAMPLKTRAIYGAETVFSENNHKTNLNQPPLTKKDAVAILQKTLPIRTYLPAKQQEYSPAGPNKITTNYNSLQEKDCDDEDIDLTALADTQIQYLTGFQKDEKPIDEVNNNNQECTSGGDLNPDASKVSIKRSTAVELKSMQKPVCPPKPSEKNLQVLLLQDVTEPFTEKDTTMKVSMPGQTHKYNEQKQQDRPIQMLQLQDVTESGTENDTGNNTAESTPIEKHKYIKPVHFVFNLEGATTTESNDSSDVFPYSSDDTEMVLTAPSLVIPSDDTLLPAPEAFSDGQCGDFVLHDLNKSLSTGTVRDVLSSSTSGHYSESRSGDDEALTSVPNNNTGTDASSSDCTLDDIEDSNYEQIDETMMVKLRIPSNNRYNVTDNGKSGQEKVSIPSSSKKVKKEKKKKGKAASNMQKMDPRISSDDDTLEQPIKKRTKSPTSVAKDLKQTVFKVLNRARAASPKGYSLEAAQKKSNRKKQHERSQKAWEEGDDEPVILQSRSMRRKSFPLLPSVAEMVHHSVSISKQQQQKDLVDGENHETLRTCRSTSDVMDLVDENEDVEDDVLQPFLLPQGNTERCQWPLCITRNLAVKVCHHGDCCKHNSGHPLQLCEDCDSSVHQDPPYHKHTRFDLRPPSPEGFNRHVSSPIFPTLPNEESGNEDDLDFTDNNSQNIEKKASTLRRRKAIRKAVPLDEDDIDDVPAYPYIPVPDYPPPPPPGYAEHTSVIPPIDYPTSPPIDSNGVGESEELVPVKVTEVKCNSVAPAKKMPPLPKTAPEYFTLQMDILETPAVTETIRAVKGVPLKDAIQPTLEKYSLSLEQVDLYLLASNTPLPLTVDCFPLGGNFLHVKGKDPNAAIPNKFLRSASALSLPTVKPHRQSNPVRQKPATNGRQKDRVMSVGEEALQSGVYGSQLSISSAIDSTRIKAKKDRPFGLFSPFGTNKITEKQELLQQILDNYSQNGCPPLPDLLTLGVEDIDENILDIENHWTDVVHMKASDLTKRQRDHQEAVWELLHTEVNYLHKIRAIVDVFYSCLLNLQNEQILNDVKTEEVFLNIMDIRQCNETFWTEYLLPTLEHSRETGQLLDPSMLYPGFMKFDELFKPYGQYCLEQRNCLDYIRTKENENELFHMFVQWAEAQKPCNRLRLQDLVAAPMQRITKYKLLLSAIGKKSDNETHKRLLIQMVENVDSYVRQINTVMHQRAQHERLKIVIDRIDSYQAVDASNDEIQRLSSDFCRLDLTCPVPGCSPHQRRQLVLEGGLTFRESQSSKKEVYCFLFTDMLLVTRHQRKTDKLKLIKPPMRLDKLVFQMLKEQQAFMLIYLNEYGMAGGVYHFQGNSNTIKVWLDHLRQTQEYYKTLRRTAFEQHERQMDWELFYDDSYEDEVAILNPSAILNVPTSPRVGLDGNTGDGELSHTAIATSLLDEQEVRGLRVVDGLSRSDSEPLRHSLSLPRNHSDLGQSSQSKSRSSHLTSESLNSQDSGHYSMEESRKPQQQRRAVRSDKRYHTADSIRELQLSKDSSIQKRHSLNYGQTGTDNRQSAVVGTSTSSDSLSVHSSSGVSSSGSLMVAGVENDTFEDGAANHNQDTLLNVDNSQSDASSTNESSATLTEVGCDDENDFMVLRTDNKTLSKSMPNVLSNDDVPSDSEDMQAPRPKRHVDVLRLKKQLLLNSTLEASEV